MPVAIKDFVRQLWKMYQKTVLQDQPITSREDAENVITTITAFGASRSDAIRYLSEAGADLATLGSKEKPNA